MTSARPLIEFSHVTKKYGAFAASDDLSFQIAKGEIHAIIGENGAGKTTAMKMLFGLEAPTSGTIKFNEVPRTWSSPRGAMAAGLGMVHQHFMLSPVHTALDNVILGREVKSDFIFSRLFAPVSRTRLRSELETLAASIGFSIPWDQPVGSLAVGTQQQLEIIKLLHAGVDVMIFDEPTAVLSPEETKNFLALIKDLNRRGKTIIIITHKLKEVKEVADSITVLRRGKSVGSVRRADVSVQDMADLMVGRHVQLGDIDRPAQKPGLELLSFRNLSLAQRGRRNLLSDISLSVRGGQIVGIAGVEGSGQAELARLIQNPKAGSRDFQMSGQIEILGALANKFSNHDVRTRPIGIVPADRHREAVLPTESLLENDLLGHDQEFTKTFMPGRQWINRRKARERLASELETFDVRPRDPDARMAGLSGGNQQKFVMARELSRNPRLILISQPTRGVDVGSIEQIHSEILNRRNHGAGVLLISSQIEELMALSDIIYVMFEGRVVGCFKRGDFDEGKIGRAMGGAAR